MNYNAQQQYRAETAQPAGISALQELIDLGGPLANLEAMIDGAEKRLSPVLRPVAPTAQEASNGHGLNPVISQCALRETINGIAQRIAAMQFKLGAIVDRIEA